MEIIRTALIVIGYAIAIGGGGLGLITYFSNSARSIRKSDADIKLALSYKGTIDFLMKAKERAEKSEQTMLKEISELKANVSMLLTKNGFSEEIINQYKLIVAYVKSCKHNKLNTDNCPVAIKMRELDIDNKKV